MYLSIYAVVGCRGVLNSKHYAVSVSKSVHFINTLNTFILVEYVEGVDFVKCVDNMSFVG